MAMALVLTPALAVTAPKGRGFSPPAVNARPVGSFTPAVADPRLQAVLARSRSRAGAAAANNFRFTPATATSEANRSVRVAIRARASAAAQAARTVETQNSSSPVTAITPSSYNLGVSVGWKGFAVTGDVAEKEGGLVPGRRESARVGMSYRPDERLTGRVEVSAERAEGVQRIIAEDSAYSLNVGGSYTIARNLDVTGGVRYRISRDRLEPISGDERRDSQAVYIGTAFRF